MRAAHAANFTSQIGTCGFLTRALLDNNPTAAGEDGLEEELDQAGSTPHLHLVSSNGQPALQLQCSPASLLAGHAVSWRDCLQFDAASLWTARGLTTPKPCRT